MYYCWQICKREVKREAATNLCSLDLLVLGLEIGMSEEPQKIVKKTASILHYQGYGNSAELSWIKSRPTMCVNKLQKCKGHIDDVAREFYPPTGSSWLAG